MVQETILKLITINNEQTGNLFMVGDVKQSIYRFRLAEPNLFLEKYKKFTPSGDESGLRIDLSRNFRSRKEILEGVNFLFKQIMGTEVGEIEYNAQAELIKGSGYPDDATHPIPIELTIIDQHDESPEKQNDENSGGESEFNPVELEQSHLESRFIAKKIRKLIDQKSPVYDLKKKSTRPIRYKDIVILTRSLSWAPELMDELKHAGIPAYANITTGYFHATEIATMLSLLQIIDNPDQDIPLAAVLRSPIIGLTEEELAQIKLIEKRSSFYSAVKRFTDNGMSGDSGELQEKLTKFLKTLNEWRTLARSGSLAQLIWQLYRDTGFYEFVGGLPGGKQRQANLRALYDRARQYEETAFKGLFRFLHFIERMRERGNDLGAARALGEQEDVVRIMTIHSSKGLEFPVVFVGGMARKFNMMDINHRYLFDKEFGFASKYVNPEKRISNPSLPQLALKRKKKMELLAEEMRVLYVALTRAKENLFLVASVKSAEKEMKKWSAALQSPRWLISDFDRAQATSYLDWVGLSLARHPASVPYLEEWREVPAIVSHSSKWKMEILPKTAFEEEAVQEDQDNQEWLRFVKEGKKLPVDSTQKSLLNRLTWDYGHEYATKHLAKQSVTEIKRMFDSQDEDRRTTMQTSTTVRAFDRPTFLQETTSLSPAERGTAMHTVMQHISLKTSPTLQSVEALVEDLVHREILTSEQAEVISTSQIVEFFTSEIGAILLSGLNVQREIPFTMGIPAQELYPDWNGENENILVQGIIDCLVKTESGVVLLDYKTDTIKGRFPQFDAAKNVLTKRYQTQLMIYKRAVKEILHEEVIGTYLYFFDTGDFLLYKE